MDILKGLNKEQIEAVTTTEGYIRVVAGAGSGKTRALTSRYAYLVDELGVPTSRILSVTFTNKAANEMKERIAKMVGEVGTPYIMTFHGFSNRVLRDEIDKMGYPRRFKIIDSEDQVSLLKPVYEELGLTNKDYAYKKAISDLIGKGCKTGDRSIVANYEELMDKYTSKELDEMMKMATTIESKIVLGYLREQKKDYCLDYEDLLNFVLYIFKKHKYVRENWQENFDYIQVDEFQDVSLREFELVSILSQKNNNLFVVGDPDQVLYSWRGANVNCIVKFEEILSKIKGSPIETTTIFLNTNYRSTPEILDVSNSLIKHNFNRLEKELITPNNTGARVLHYHAKSVYQEAEWVAKRILSLNRSFSDFAILYRNNAVSRALEEKLVSYRIPYEVLSGISFYQRKEVKDVLAVLSIVAFEDNTSFKRVITNNPLGLGKKRIETLVNIANESNITMYQALKENIGSKTFKSTKGYFLVALIEELRAIKDTKKISDLMDRVIQAFDYEEVYLKADEQERYENIIELKTSARHFEFQEGEKVDLADYLGTLSLYSEADKEESIDKVKLMTVHASKGLEYPVIFVVGMNEGLMPSSRTVTEEDMEEERRVAYVAMTRARELLFLTDAEGENYDRSMRLPSRFLFNIERDLYNTEGVMDKYIENYAKEQISLSESRLVKTTRDIIDDIKVVDDGLKVGDRVFHSIFKEGVIIKEEKEAFLVMFDLGQAKGFRKENCKLVKI